MSICPSAFATGPILPTWQSPQIHTDGAVGIECVLCSPRVELQGVAAHAGMRAARHLQILQNQACGWPLPGDLYDAFALFVRISI
jgi:hypothetical protein